jgi:hypothetical protein
MGGHTIPLPFHHSNRFFIRDFFAFCKEVLPYDIAEIKEEAER